MTLLGLFTRVTRMCSCPICGKPDWCLIGRAGSEFEGAAICSRTESDCRFGTAGFLHWPADSKPNRPRSRRITLSLRPDSDTFARFAMQSQAGLTAESLATLSERLQVSRESLRRLELGEVTAALAAEYEISWAHGAWAFPMRDEQDAIIGIRLRMRDGHKCAVPGSHEGLFLPRNVGSARQLLICEGASDTAAMLDLGFDVIGRPSARGGAVRIRRYLQAARLTDIAIISDSDSVGQSGGRDLARSLAPGCASVRLITPPPGSKDARSWRIGGATTADVQTAIDAATPWTVRISVRSNP